MSADWAGGSKVIVVTGYSATPHTHAPPFSFASGGSRAQLPNVYQNIHCGGENEKWHALYDAARGRRISKLGA